MSRWILSKHDERAVIRRGTKYADVELANLVLDCRGDRAMSRKALRKAKKKDKRYAKKHHISRCYRYKVSFTDGGGEGDALSLVCVDGRRKLTKGERKQLKKAR